MMKRIVLTCLIFALGMLFGWHYAQRSTANAVAQNAQAPTTPPTPGYILERDAEVKKEGAAPHNGPGRSTGYSFFDKVTSFKYVFRKRVLHPGAAIGYHPQK